MKTFLTQEKKPSGLLDFHDPNLSKVDGYFTKRYQKPSEHLFPETFPYTVFDAALNYIQFLSLCIFVYVRFSFLYFLSLLVLSDQKQAVAQRYSIKHVFLEISQIHKKTTVSESLFRPATLLKARLWHICFHVNFAKFLRTPSVTEHFRTTAF